MAVLRVTSAQQEGSSRIECPSFVTARRSGEQRAGAPEVWLIHPTDRTLAIYRLEDGRYGRPIYQELKGQTLLSAVLGVSIDWDRMTARLV